PWPTSISSLSLHDALPIWLAEVALDIDRERFEGRDVHHSRRGLLRSRREHEMVDRGEECRERLSRAGGCEDEDAVPRRDRGPAEDRKSTRLNSSHVAISYA